MLTKSRYAILTQHYKSEQDQNNVTRVRTRIMQDSRPTPYPLHHIGLVGRVFTNDPGSIPGRVIPKTLKMVLDTSLLKTQHYKIRVKSKVKQPREKSSALLVVAFEKRAF